MNVEGTRNTSLNLRTEALSLVLYPDSILRTVCQPVERHDSTLRDIVQEMFTLMREHRGIGLAGPQVGLSRRLFICAYEGAPLCLTNVEIRDAAEERLLAEGCLSLPGIQVKVRRPERIRVHGYDEKGRSVSYGATGLWARMIQHELDHLNGVLICDYGPHSDESCRHCALTLPTVLVEERKRWARPASRHKSPIR